MISFWSVFSATVWFSVVSLLLYTLHGRTGFLMRYGVTVLSAVAGLTIVRMLLPLDSTHMIVVRSYTVLLALSTILKYQLWEGVSVRLLLKGIWASGALFGAIFVLFGVFRDRWRLRRLFTVPIPPEVRETVQKNGIDVNAVRMTPEILTPMVTGFWHPTIYLPAREYLEPDLLWILRHEMSHFSGHDAWLRLGFLLFRCLFWWNPLVHLSQKLVDDILELRCDKAVLSDADKTGRKEYVRALYRAASQICRSDPSFIGAGTFVQSPKGGVLAARARLAMEKPHPDDRKVVAVLVLSVALFVVSYIFILQPAGFPPDMEGGAEMYQVTPETSYIRKTPSGDYELWCNGEYAGPVSDHALNDELHKNLEVRP